jgi:hypothetical protein
MADCPELKEGIVRGLVRLLLVISHFTACQKLRV